MKNNLNGYVALITGGSSGMGFEMARQLLSEGATVVIAARGGVRLQTARNTLAACGYDVYALTMDVTKEESVAEAAKWFSERFDRLDMLVNNAGIGNNAPGMEKLSREHPFYEVPGSAVRAVLETNLLGYFLVTQQFLPIMLRQGQGRLLYVSTSDATMTRPGQIPYGPSKAGAEAMTAVMVQELRDTGVTVNIICPGGFTDTPMAGKGDKEFFQKNNMPILPPDVMNRAISFFASSQSNGIHGEKIVCKEFGSWLACRGLE